MHEVILGRINMTGIEMIGNIQIIFTNLCVRNQMGITPH